MQSTILFESANQAHQVVFNNEENVPSQCMIYLCAYPTDRPAFTIKTTNVLHSYQFKAACKAAGIEFSVHTRDIADRNTKSYVQKPSVLQRIRNFFS